MKSKALILLSIFFIIFSLTTMCFATDQVKNDVHNVTDTVIDGAENLTEDVRNGVGQAENVVEDAAQDVGNAVNDGLNTVEDMGNDIGATTRDAIDDTTGTMTNNNYDNMNDNDGLPVWAWIIIAAAVIVIIAVIWYYVSQNKDER